MNDNELPKSVGEDTLSPVSLSDEQQKLCKQLDDLYIRYDSLKARPSDMFRGAIFAKRAECRSNEDWVAQAANSLREILYPFWSDQVKAVPDKKSEAFKKYGSVRINEELIEEIDRIYGILNDLTHHGSNPRHIKNFASFTITDFENLVNDFEKIIPLALSRQIDIHQEIDDILVQVP